MRAGSFTHDPFEVDLISHWKAVFSHFSIAMVFVEANRARVFAENTDINFGGIVSGELFFGPSHEFFAETLTEILLADIELPEFHGSGSWVFSGCMHRADFRVADELVTLRENLEM